MNNEDIAVRLTDHENEIGSLKHRMTAERHRAEVAV